MSRNLPLDTKLFENGKATLYDIVMSREGTKVEERPLHLPRPCWRCRKPGKLLCTACFAGTYCSKECQREHWEVHKHGCKAVKKLFQRLHLLAEELKEDKMFDYTGDFWGFVETRPYMRKRIEIVESYRKNFGDQSTAVELAMLHMMQMMFLCHKDNMALREKLPLLMVAQGYLYEAQCMMSYWAHLHRLEDAPVAPAEKSFSEKGLLLFSRKDTVEYNKDLKTYCGNYAQASECVAAAMVLFATYQRATLLQCLEDSKLPAVAAELIVSFLYHPFLHDPKKSPQVLKKYLNTYLTSMGKFNKTILKGLANPAPGLLSPRSQCTAHGTYLDTVSVLHSAKEALAAYPGFSKYVADLLFDGNRDVKYSSADDKLDPNTMRIMRDALY